MAELGTRGPGLRRAGGGQSRAVGPGPADRVPDRARSGLLRRPEPGPGDVAGPAATGRGALVQRGSPGLGAGAAAGGLHAVPADLGPVVRGGSGLAGPHRPGPLPGLWAARRGRLPAPRGRRGGPRLMSVTEAAGAPRLTPRVREIVATALALLEEHGAEALTMRRLADQLGIRAPSLYKHLAGKAELEAAVIAIGFEVLAAALEQAEQAERGRGPGSGLEQLGAAYRSFAL